MSFVARLSSIDIQKKILKNQFFNSTFFLVVSQYKIYMKNVWSFTKNVLHCVSMVILFSKVQKNAWSKYKWSKSYHINCFPWMSIPLYQVTLVTVLGGGQFFII